MLYTDIKLVPELMDGILDMGYKETTPIQEQAIPLLLDGHDIIGCAKTGTGKTAAFLIPIINHIILNKEKNPGGALVITPTRELAKQIDQIADGLRYHTDVESVSVYGGTSSEDYSQEREALKEGTSLVIGTPGRLMSHLNMGILNGENIHYLILDEADRMLDMGFYDDIMRIVKHLPNLKQRLMFSATMPGPIKKLARGMLTDPKEIMLSVTKTADNLDLQAVSVKEEEKGDFILNLLKEKKFEKAIIFTATKAAAKFVSFKLQSSKIPGKSIHSDKTQAEREDIMLRFKTGELKILVATDILSRGIDIDDIDIVINYSVPPDPEDYVHRVGRTARAEKKGEALTLVSWRDQKSFLKIEEQIGQEINIVEAGEGFTNLGFDREKIRAAPARSHHKKKKPYGKKKYSGKPRDKKRD